MKNSLFILLFLALAIPACQQENLPIYLAKANQTIDHVEFKFGKSVETPGYIMVMDESDLANSTGNWVLSAEKKGCKINSLVYGKIPKGYKAEKYYDHDTSIVALQPNHQYSLQVEDYKNSRQDTLYFSVDKDGVVSEISSEDI
jgi:hypothetical protein